MVVKLVSLGGGCRPAHQIRVFAAETPVVEAPSFPFDWTITSFDALKVCLAPDFDIDRMLRDDQLKLSFARSGQCGDTNLIFHHAIENRLFSAFSDVQSGDEMPRNAEIDHFVTQARDRFRHTYDRFRACRESDDHFVFVRWQRLGIPDAEYPQAFAGETPEGLCNLLEAFVGKGRFKLLLVTTQLVPGAASNIPEPLVRLDADGPLIAATIRERKGWNGDQSNDFRGDEPSWRRLLTEALQRWDLPVVDHEAPETGCSKE